MAKILLIDTATEVCGAAISVDGKVVAVFEDKNCESHVGALTLQIQSCCEATGIRLQELDAVAIGGGPGSYTTLRVGVSAAKSLCYNLEKPLIAVDSLAAVAWAAASKMEVSSDDQVLFIPMFDARRSGVCCKIFDQKLNLISGMETLQVSNNMFVENITTNARKSLENFFAEGDSTRLVFSGNGSEKMKNVFLDEKSVFSGITKNSPMFLAQIAEQSFQANDFQNFAHFEPVYMKPPNITHQKETHF